ncbi:MAG: hypothetical protein IIV99_02620 [Oscillospiraceae bacterium]|nr:hypothetical protein [Oscillospiraceae bacterium]
MKKVFSNRIRILSLLVAAVFFVYSMKLVQYQIIEGEHHYEESNTSVSFQQTLTASRGDIVDAYGTPIASSQIIFNVILNRAYLPADQLNQRIIEVLEILEENGEDVNDILPLSKDYPYTFAEGADSEIEWVRKTLELNIYATEDDIVEKLGEKYKLSDVPKNMWRKVGGIRYTMDREGYTLSLPFTIAKDVGEKTVAVVSENSRELTGVEIYDTSKRYYEDGTILPHIMGIVGPIYAEEYAELKAQGYKINDTLGKSGLEKLYESFLKGSDGSLAIERNLYGEITKREILDTPTEGDTVKLTIDYQLQDALNDILKNQLEVLQARPAGDGKESTGVSAVVIDVKTGGILAIGSYPSYDLNLYSSNYSEYSKDENNPLFNRATQGLYRPGSVFKCFVALAALQEGLIDADYTYNCTGIYTYYAPSYTPGCAYGTAHGVCDVTKALQVSCNCFFYEMGRLLGVEKMNEIAHQMGLGVKTGLEISEKTGIVSNPQYTESLGGTWEAGNVIQTAIGQLDTALTTVQLATYASTLANEGVRKNTHIVDSIIAQNGEIVYETPITVLSECPDKNDSYRIVEEGMVKASSQGAASRFFGELPYTIASKTGTAQVPGGYHNATIMAYGPTENPEIAVAVICEKAGNGYNLAESVADIYQEYYRLKELRQNENWREILENPPVTETEGENENPENQIQNTDETVQ